MSKMKHIKVEWIANQIYLHQRNNDHISLYIRDEKPEEKGVYGNCQEGETYINKEEAIKLKKALNKFIRSCQ